MASIGLSKPACVPTLPLAVAGSRAPASPTLVAAERLRVVAFLRHVGCPFAENTVRQLRSWALNHPQVAVFVVSHGNASATREWLGSIGGQGVLRLVVDPSRALHAEWGVGYSGLMHFAGLPSLAGVLALLFKGIRNRSASGTRWQQAALFLVDGEQVAWVHLPHSAQEFMLPPEQLLTP